jgi:hypothetical protein
MNDEISTGRFVPQAQTDAELRQQVLRDLKLPRSVMVDAVRREAAITREIARRTGQVSDDGIIDWSAITEDGSLPETVDGTLTDNPGPHQYTATFTNPWNTLCDPSATPGGWVRVANSASTASR